VVAPQDLVFHFRLAHRRAEVVPGLDLGGDLLTEHHRLCRRFDRDFEFRLLVFLDAKVVARCRPLREPMALIELNLVLPEHRIGR